MMQGNGSCRDFAVCIFTLYGGSCGSASSTTCCGSWSNGGRGSIDSVHRVDSLGDNA